MTTTNLISKAGFATDKSLLAQATRRIQKWAPPSYATLISLQWSWSTQVPFAATDGRRLLLNPHGMEKIQTSVDDPVGVTAFVLVHESLHAQLNHGARLNKLSDHQLANEAADYVINAVIHRINKENQIKFDPTCRRELFPLWEGCLFDPKLSEGKAVEELYSELFNGKASTDGPDGQPSGMPAPDDDDGEDSDTNGGGGSSVDPSDAGPDSDGDAEGDDTGDSGSPDSSGNNEADPDAPTKEKTGGIDGAGGSPVDPDQKADREEEGKADGSNSPTDSDEDDPSDSSDSSSKGDEPPSYEEPELYDLPGCGSVDTMPPELTEEEEAEGRTPADIEEGIQRANETRALQAALDVGAGAGSATLNRAIADAGKRPSTMDWKAAVIDELQQHTRDHGWEAPVDVMHYASTGYVQSGRGGRKLETLGIVMDTSGSISPALLSYMLASAKEVVEAIEPSTVLLISCDWEVQSTVELSAGEEWPNRLAGGGGTLVVPAFEWMDDNGPPDALIYFTDGQTPEIIYPHLYKSSPPDYVAKVIADCIGDRAKAKSLTEPDYPVVWVHWGPLYALEEYPYPFGKAVFMQQT